MALTHSPWGRIEHKAQLAKGIMNVSTASHGGIHLSDGRLAAMPDYMQREGGWYEEDCEWSMPAVVFPEAFPKHQELAKESLRNWFPEIYERFFGVTVGPEESYMRAKEVFEQQVKDKYVVVSAWGDWHEAVPDGKVGVLAKLGCNRDLPEGKYALVDGEAYAARTRHGYVLDGTEPEWNPNAVVSQI